MFEKFIWLICMANVGKYTSPMDPMGFGKDVEKSTNIGQRLSDSPKLRDC